MALGRPTGLRGLGIIPDWQYYDTDRLTPTNNPFVKFPAGWNQRTVQPVGVQSFRTVQLGLFTDSWWWENRKPLAIGGAVLVGVGAFSLLGSIFR